jgi:hypothetical protein
MIIRIYDIAQINWSLSSVFCGGLGYGNISIAFAVSAY